MIERVFIQQILDELVKSLEKSEISFVDLNLNVLSNFIMHILNSINKVSANVK